MWRVGENSGNIKLLDISLVNKSICEVHFPAVSGARKLLSNNAVPLVYTKTPLYVRDSVHELYVPMC